MTLNWSSSQPNQGPKWMCSILKKSSDQWIGKTHKAAISIQSNALGQDDLMCWNSEKQRALFWNGKTKTKNKTRPLLRSSLRSEIFAMVGIKCWWTQALHRRRREKLWPKAQLHLQMWKCHLLFRILTWPEKETTSAQDHRDHHIIPNKCFSKHYLCLTLPALTEQPCSTSSEISKWLLFEWPLCFSTLHFFSQKEMKYTN